MTGILAPWTPASLAADALTRRRRRGRPAMTETPAPWVTPATAPVRASAVVGLWDAMTGIPAPWIPAPPAVDARIRQLRRGLPATTGKPAPWGAASTAPRPSLPGPHLPGCR